MFLRFTIFIAGVLLTALPLFADAAAKPPPYHYVRLFYYTEGKKSTQDFYAHPSSIDIFAPQTYALLSDGTLGGSLKPELVHFAKAHNIKIMPLVTNDDFGATAYQTLLTDPQKAASAILTLVTVAKEQGYDGWQFDFEQMQVDYKDSFSAFIKQAAEAFHAAGLTISVAVIAKVSDNPADYPLSFWEKHIGVYDYDALASVVDFVSIMSYDDPNKVGPVAPMPWWKDVLAYSLQHIPKEKISMGIPLYYWLMNEENKILQIGGNGGIQEAFRKHYVSVHWSTHSVVPYLEWHVGKKEYTLWYENGKSVSAKIAEIKKEKLYGVSFWSLGLPHPSIWNSVKQ